MPSLNTVLAHNVVDRSVDMLRLAADTRARVNRLLKQLEKQLVSLVAEDPLTAFNNRRYRDMLASVREVTTTTFDQAARVTQDVTEGIMLHEIEATASSAKAIVGIDLLGESVPVKWVESVVKNSLTQGATNEAWWARQAQDLVFRFEQQVRLGMVANETTDKIIARIRGDGETAGVLYQTRANAAALVQTSIATAANQARLEMYRANSDVLRGVQQISTLDDRTTDICAAYDMAAWDLDGEPIDGTGLPFNGGPPRHWNCRSTLVPIVKSSEELGTDIVVDNDTRASMDGALADKTTFNDWLEGKSEAKQNEILGEGRAQLWRDGKITLRDLLDQSGRPLTLEQLNERVKR